MLSRLLIQVMNVTTVHQKLLEMGKNSIKAFFIAHKAKKKTSGQGQSPVQELKAGPQAIPSSIAENCFSGSLGIYLRMMGHYFNLHHLLYRF